MAHDADIHVHRCHQLMAQMPADAIAVLFGASEQQRNSDVTFPFRQKSDLFYLAGFDEPEVVLVLVPGRAEGEKVMFCRERDPERERWEGSRAGTRGACERFGMDQAWPIEDIDEMMPALLADRRQVFGQLGENSADDSRLLAWVTGLRHQARRGVAAPTAFVALDQLLHEMRLIKSTVELDLMRRAAAISVEAHCRAMRYCQPGHYEYQLEAEINHCFRQAGCRSEAYPSIVGGGENACILHYIDNRDRLQDGDLVLIDAGCEYQFYAADITRTFPVNGRFSPPQRALYEVVLAAQDAAIAAVKPGNSWNAFHEAAVTVLCQGLLDLGLLQGDLAENLAAGHYRRFYMHRTGHWLGMDVHDVGDYKCEGDWRPLQPGMVLTVEPGLYIPSDSDDVEERWRGIGIRIEDDVVVTSSGCEVLSAGVPRTVDEIESWMANGKSH